MTIHPSTGVRGFEPGRQDKALSQFNPVFRSANLYIAPLTFSPRGITPRCFTLALIHMLIIRRAEREDCLSIAYIHTSAVRALSTSLYTPEEIEAWAVPRTPENYKQSIRRKEFYVAVEDDSGTLVNG